MGLCRICAGRQPLLISRSRMPAGVFRANGAAALRWSDRASLPSGSGSGWRSGSTAFGAAAHIVAQVARFEGRRSSPSPARATARRGNPRWRWARDWARRIGRGASPVPLDAAILFAPVGAPCRRRCGRRQGRNGGLRRHPYERHSGLPYAIFWGERQIRSVANLTRRDAIEFRRWPRASRVRTEVTTFLLAEANEAPSAPAGHLTGRRC